MTNNLTFKRVCAYLIDYIIITFISAALIQISFINPRYDKYVEISNTYNDILADYSDNKIDINEFAEKQQELSYDLNKNGYVYIIGSITISMLYFGVFAYFTKGQTLGKKIMNIKLVNAKEDKDLKIYQYFIRAIVLNGILLNLVILIAICFDRSTYNSIYNISSNINTILEILIFVTVVLNGRGIHDYIAGTKVISTKELVQDNLKEETEEVTVIKPNKKNKSKKEN